MQQAQDIVGLYRTFGGTPESFQEITRTHAVEQARERWPLIAALEALSMPAAAAPEPTPTPTPVSKIHHPSQQISPLAQAQQAPAAPVLEAKLAPQPTLPAAPESVEKAHVGGVATSPLSRLARPAVSPPEQPQPLQDSRQPADLQQIFAQMLGMRNQP